MELWYQGSSEEELRSCANITSAEEKLIVQHKALPTYKEVDAVYT